MIKLLYYRCLASFELAVTKAISLYVWTLFFFTMLLCLLSLSAPADASSQQDAVPAGFEHLSGVQSVYATLLFHGKQLGLVRIQVDHSFLKISDIDALLDKLPINTGSVELMRDRLSQSLAVNSNALCRYKQGQQKRSNSFTRQICSMPRPKVASVVYDPETYGLYLFLNSRYLQKKVLNASAYLEDATGGAAWINRSDYQSGSYFSRDGQTHQITNSGHLSRYNTAIYYSNRLSNNVFDENNKRKFYSHFDNIYLNYYKKKYHYQAGYLTLSGRYFLPTVEVAGLAWGTNKSLMSQDIDTNGSPLFVYLPLPGLVSIYRGRVLLTSGYYDAGEQRLDTTGLPAGSYSVRVITNAGTPQQQTQDMLYTNSALLAPFKHPQYRFAAGYVEDTSIAVQENLLPPVSQRDWYTQFSWDYRLAARWGMTFGASLADHHKYALQGGILRVGSRVTNQLAFLAGSYQSYGFNLASIFSIARWSNQLSIQRIWSSHDDIVDLNSADFNDNNPFSQIFVKQYALSDSMSSTIFGWQIGVNGNYQRTAAGARNYAYGSSLARTFRILGELSMRSRTSYSQGNLGWEVMTNLDFSLQHNAGRTYNTVSVNNGFSHQMGQSGYAVGGRYSFARSNKLGSSLNLSAGVQQTAADRWYRARAGVQTSPFYLDGQWQTNNDLQDRSLSHSYTVSAGTGFALSSRAFVLGIGRSGTSGVIVKIKGGTSKDRYKILIDNHAKGIVKGNAATYVMVSPFQRHSVSLVQVNADSLREFDNKAVEVLLRPGGVHTIIFKINKKRLFYGVLLDKNHQPMIHARIKNSLDHATTNESGFFQCEVLSGDAFLDIHYRGKRCRITLPAEGSKAYINLKRQVCRI